jgi:hypothetical protein
MLSHTRMGQLTSVIAAGLASEIMAHYWVSRPAGQQGRPGL